MSPDIKAINMPKWGMEMSEGDVTAWHAVIGDQVSAGDDLIDVETSKIVNTVTSPDSGILRAIVADPGETCAVGDLLGVLASADTSNEEIQAFIASRSAGTVAKEVEPAPIVQEPAPAVAEPVQEIALAAPIAPIAAMVSSESTAMATLADGDDDSAVAASPVARRLAAEYGVNLNNISGTGRHGRVSKSDLESAITAAGGVLASVSSVQAPGLTDSKSLADGVDDSNVSASPVARRLAIEYGVNLNNISGTGRHGRVSKSDLENAVTAAGGELIRTNNTASTVVKLGDDSHIKATPVARRLAEELGVNLLECRVSGDRGRVCKADVEAVAARKNKPLAPSIDTSGSITIESPFEPEVLTGMRKTIAGRLQSSKQTAPHFRVQIDAEIDTLLAVRKQINAANSAAKVSVNDFMVKACAAALMQVPAINVQFDGEQVKYFKDADISVAVAVADGLITPIVSSANRKGLIAISNEVRDLATRAKINRLKPSEFVGGSFCISNLGMFGIKQFDAIINPPQGAILAVGTGEQRPVVKEGQLSIATVVSLTLSSDHRIIDGAVAAQFMSILKGYLEQPATMLG
ncbi:MAG: pyruvate dehydrogenase E2 component (dihydrolipoamide acetyltransferase) [Parasphingorhabdus sp.]|jgi:pyruvate dehydrogenase E2 component (dihydrolipoamide acetyltransferase)|tara:strand:+ start:2287 stop:4020 length:1734 start_codon:yes stop_codon:yes gene_type:complete